MAEIRQVPKEVDRGIEGHKGHMQLIAEVRVVALWPRIQMGSNGGNRYVIPNRIPSTSCTVISRFSPLICACASVRAARAIAGVPSVAEMTFTRNVTACAVTASNMEHERTGVIFVHRHYLRSDESLASPSAHDIIVAIALNETMVLSASTLELLLFLSSSEDETKETWTPASMRRFSNASRCDLSKPGHAIINRE